MILEWHYLHNIYNGRELKRTHRMNENRYVNADVIQIIVKEGR